jgi:hypothetical protein
VGNGKNLSRRRYLDGGGIRKRLLHRDEGVCVCVCVCIYACACVCVWSAILTTLTAGARLLYRASLSPLANGSSGGGDWGPDMVGACGKKGYRASIVDRRSCESVVRNPKGAIVFV